MACDLTAGRNVPCKDVVGGLVAAWFVDHGDLQGLVLTNDEITDAEGSFQAYQYNLHGANSMESAITSSRENGTTFFETTVTLTLPKLSKEDNVQLKLLAFGRPHLVLEDRNGNFLLVGKEHGCEVTGGTMVSGSGFSDLSGYTLTLTSSEALPPNFISGGTSANPFVGLTSCSATIVVGSNS